MKNLLFYFSITVFLLLTACSEKNNTFVVQFDGPSTEKKWAIQELNSELSSDWSSFDFLTLELKSSTTQRFELKLYDVEGMRRIRVHPFQGAWVRASIPLFRFKKMNTEGTTLSSTFQAGLPGCWINFHQGPFGSINHIDSLGVAMVAPIGSPILEIRNVKLTMTAQDTIFEPLPLVDEFGQWIPAEWPGKAKSLDELKTAWSEEEKALQTDNLNLTKYGGFLDKKTKATGFFRVEKIDDKWWFIDPEGYLFYSIGSTGILPNVAISRIEGRKYIFTALPPAAELAVPNQSPRRGPGYSFYTWNLYRRFGSDWYQKWMDLTVRRMDNWGLNTIANWSDATLGGSHRKAYVATISGWETNPKTMGMPDVYAPDYIAKVDAAAARQCEYRKEDPYLLGYFIGNEPVWPGRESELVEIILAGEATSMQAELKKFLAGGDTPERRKVFVYDTYSKFISVVDAAIKKYDPNHLNLGLRFGGSAPVEIIKASKNYFDVFSINIYGYVCNPKEIQRIYDLTGLPIIIGEFHFGTPGRGLAPGLAQTKNQEERGVAYRYYVENAAAHPAVIGTHWFQWLDQPSTGRNDGENYNIGMVDVTDRPYKEFIEAVKETHKRLMDVHSGKESPVNRQADIQ